MLMKDFVDEFNAKAEHGFVLSVVVDTNSEADQPNSLYQLSRNDVVFGTYSNSVLAQEGYNASVALLLSEGAISPDAEPEVEPEVQPEPEAPEEVEDDLASEENENVEEGNAL